MPQLKNDQGQTVSYKRNSEKEAMITMVLQSVYGALEEKGYDPVDQLVGYLISGDPAYITSYKQARGDISRLERDEIVKLLLRSYMKEIQG